MPSPPTVRQTLVDMGISPDALDTPEDQALQTIALLSSKWMEGRYKHRLFCMWLIRARDWKEIFEIIKQRWPLFNFLPITEHGNLLRIESRLLDLHSSTNQDFRYQVDSTTKQVKGEVDLFETLGDLMPKYSKSMSDIQDSMHDLQELEYDGLEAIQKFTAMVVGELKTENKEGIRTLVPVLADMLEAAHKRNGNYGVRASAAFGCAMELTGNGQESNEDEDDSTVGED